MKRLLAGLVVVTLLVSSFAGFSYAGDEGWAVAGGFVGGLVLGSALSNRSCGYYYGPGYYPRGYYCPRDYYYPRYRAYYPYSYPRYRCYPTTTYIVEDYCY